MAERKRAARKKKEVAPEELCRTCKFSYVEPSRSMRFCRFAPPLTGTFPVVNDNWYCGCFELEST